MRTMIIKEEGTREFESEFTFDLSQTDVAGCIGCWSCWWKTPGRCIHKDLDEFYRQYINAEKVIYFSKVKKGFVSAKLKTLFDRMIPLYLPYVTYKTGESMHAPRYEKYPDIEFYYDGEFETEEGPRIFEDYIARVFYQFHSKNILVKPISEYVSKEGGKQ